MLFDEDSRGEDGKWYEKLRNPGSKHGQAWSFMGMLRLDKTSDQTLNERRLQKARVSPSIMGTNDMSKPSDARHPYNIKFVNHSPSQYKVGDEAEGELIGFDSLMMVEACSNPASEPGPGRRTCKLVRI